jgi:hypothetical protein
MPNAMFQETLNYLYRELKAAKIAQAHAEKRKGVTPAELVNIRTKIDVLDGLIELVLRDYAIEDDAVEGDSYEVDD